MKLMFLQGGEADRPADFDASVAWRALIEMGESLLARVPYMIVGLLVFTGFIVAGRIAKRAIKSAGGRFHMDDMLADMLGRLASALAVIVGMFAGATVIFPTLTPGNLVAGLGITSVAIGFAFKDILQNFFAGILILWRRPFRVGDQILTNGFEGTVESITIRSTRLRTYDGERAVLPNGEVYTSAILVRSAYNRRRIRMDIGIGYNNSIEEARAIILRELRAIDGVLNEPPPQALVTELGPSSVNFTIYFWGASRQFDLQAIRDAALTRIKRALDEARIDIPYPHTVVRLEGAGAAFASTRRG